MASFPKNNTTKFVLFLLLVVLFLCLGKFFHFDQESYKSFFAHFPIALSSVIFIFVYVVLTFFIWFGPKDILRIVAAVVYGAYVSTLLVYIAEMINLMILFSWSRKMGRGFVESKLRGGMKNWDEAIASTGFWSVFFIRLFPIIPLRFLDLGFGLTKISFRKYSTICALATPFQVFWVQFFLSVGTEIVLNPTKMSEYLQQNPFVFFWSAAYTFGAIIMAVVLRKRLKTQDDSNRPPIR